MLADQITLQDFYDLLRERKMLDVTGPQWKKLSVDHGADALSKYQFQKPQEFKSLFKEQRNLCGIYCYFQNETCLYIGKSGNLQERIYQHFLESCRMWGHIRYQTFFAENCGTLDLYVLAIGGRNRDGEYLRTIVEKVHEVHYKPKMQSIKL